MDKVHLHVACDNRVVADFRPSCVGVIRASGPLIWLYSILTACSLLSKILHATLKSGLNSGDGSYTAESEYAGAWCTRGVMRRSVKPSQCVCVCVCVSVRARACVSCALHV